MPGNLKYLEEWLSSATREGGWSLADRVIPHHAEEKANDWRIAASEPVLVGVISTKDSQKRLDWIRQNRTYYHPLPRRGPHRHFYVKKVALFCPKNLTPNGITHVASVNSIEVLPRKKIVTPWKARTSLEQQFIVYHLDEFLELTSRLVNTTTGMTAFRRDRWTSRLGLERASVAAEIILETEPEWRLYDALTSSSIKFWIKSDRKQINLPDQSNLKGRAWFDLPGDQRVKYDGVNGYIIETGVRPAVSCVTVLEVLERLIATS